MPQTIQDLIRESARKAGIPEELALAVAEQESSFNPEAIGKQLPSGEQAIGTFQILPSTAKGLGIDPEDHFQNIDGGTRYLRSLLDKYEGDVEEALKEYGGVVHDTSYVPGVLGRMSRFKGANAKTTGAAPGAAPSAGPAGPTTRIGGSPNENESPAASVGKEKKAPGIIGRLLTPVPAVQRAASTLANAIEGVKRPTPAPATAEDVPGVVDIIKGLNPLPTIAAGAEAIPDIVRNLAGGYLAETARGGAAGVVEGLGNWSPLDIAGAIAGPKTIRAVGKRLPTLRGKAQITAKTGRPQIAGGAVEPEATMAATKDPVIGKPAQIYRPGANRGGTVDFATGEPGVPGPPIERAIERALRKSIEIRNQRAGTGGSYLPPDIDAPDPGLRSRLVVAGRPDQAIPEPGGVQHSIVPAERADLSKKNLAMTREDRIRRSQEAEAKETEAHREKEAAEIQKILKARAAREAEAAKASNEIADKQKRKAAAEAAGFVPEGETVSKPKRANVRKDAKPGMTEKQATESPAARATEAPVAKVAPTPEASRLAVQEVMGEELKRRTGKELKRPEVPEATPVPDRPFEQPGTRAMLEERHPGAMKTPEQRMKEATGLGKTPEPDAPSPRLTVGDQVMPQLQEAAAARAKELQDQIGVRMEALLKQGKSAKEITADPKLNEWHKQAEALRGREATPQGPTPRPEKPVESFGASLKSVKVTKGKKPKVTAAPTLEQFLRKEIGISLRDYNELPDHQRQEFFREFEKWRPQESVVGAPPAPKAVESAAKEAAPRTVLEEPKVGTPEPPVRDVVDSDGNSLADIQEMIYDRLDSLRESGASAEAVNADPRLADLHRRAEAMKAGTAAEIPKAGTKPKPSPRKEDAPMEYEDIKVPDEAVYEQVKSLFEPKPRHVEPGQWMRIQAVERVAKANYKNHRVKDPRMIDEMRRFWGSEEAARRLGLKQAEVKELSGPPHGQRPINAVLAEADARMKHLIDDPSGFLRTEALIAGGGAAAGGLIGATVGGEDIGDVFAGALTGVLLGGGLTTGAARIAQDFRKPSRTIWKDGRPTKETKWQKTKRHTEALDTAHLLAGLAAVKAGIGSIGGIAAAAFEKAKTGQRGQARAGLKFLMTQGPRIFLETLGTPAEKLGHRGFYTSNMMGKFENKNPATNPVSDFVLKPFMAFDRVGSATLKRMGYSEAEASRMMMTGEPTSWGGQLFLRTISSWFMLRMLAKFPRVRIVGLERAFEYTPGLSGRFNTRTAKSDYPSYINSKEFVEQEKLSKSQLKARGQFGAGVLGLATAYGYWRDPSLRESGIAASAAGPAFVPAAMGIAAGKQLRKRDVPAAIRDALGAALSQVPQIGEADISRGRLQQRIPLPFRIAMGLEKNK